LLVKSQTAIKLVQKAKSPDLAHVRIIVIGRVKAGGVGVHKGWLDVIVAAAGHFVRYVMMATNPHGVIW